MDCYFDNHFLCVPFVEDAGSLRILIGVGRVAHVAPSVEYRYTTKDLKGKLRSLLWERVVQHSIRPDFKDGFLLPYHAAIEKAPADPLQESAGRVTLDQVRQIAEPKMPDLNANSVEEAIKIIEGTARSLGIEVS